MLVEPEATDTVLSLSFDFCVSTTSLLMRGCDDGNESRTPLFRAWILPEDTEREVVASDDTGSGKLNEWMREVDTGV